MFSSAFFRLFFSETICPCSFAFPGDLLVIFLGRIGGILLSPTLLQIRVCWPVRLWFSSSSVSVCLLRVLCSTTGRRTCFRLLHFLGIPWAFQQLLRAHSTSPSNEMAVVMAPVLHQSVPTFIAAFRADNLTARSPTWLFPLLPALFFPALFSRVIFFFSSALDSTGSFSSVAGTLSLPDFFCVCVCVFLHCCFHHPGLVLGPPGSVDRGSDYGVACFFLPFLHTVTAKVWTESCIRRYVWTESRTHSGQVNS